MIKNEKDLRLDCFPDIQGCAGKDKGCEGLFKIVQSRNQLTKGLDGNLWNLCGISKSLPGQSPSQLLLKNTQQAGCRMALMLKYCMREVSFQPPPSPQDPPPPRGYTCTVCDPMELNPQSVNPASPRRHLVRRYCSGAKRRITGWNRENSRQLCHTRLPRTRIHTSSRESLRHSW